MASRVRVRAMAFALAGTGLLAASSAFSFDAAHAATTGRQSAPMARDIDIDQPATSPPARYFTINSVLAKLDRGIKPGQPSQLASVSPSGTLSDQPALGMIDALPTQEPFGLAMFRAPEGTLWRKWRPILAAIKSEHDDVARCATALFECGSHVARFARLVSAVRIRGGIERIREANAAVNETVHYVSDYAQWGVADRWTPALDTFARARGDCEDYAIVKYVLLRAAGMDAADLKIVLVRDRAVRADHAVLAARHDGKWLILDNRHNRLVHDTDSAELMPLFALNDAGVSLFAAPYAELGAGFEGMGFAPAAADWGGETNALQTGSGDLALTM